MKNKEDYRKELIDEPLRVALNNLDTVDAVLVNYTNNRPVNLGDFKKHISNMITTKEEVEMYNVTITLDSITKSIIDECEDLTIKWQEDITEEENDVYDRIDSLASDIEISNKSHNENLLNKSTTDNSKYIKLEEKRKLLEAYSDKIIDLCSEFGITTSDLEVTNDTFTPEQLNELYSGYLKYMGADGKANPITTLRTKLPSTTAQGVVLLIALIISFTGVLNIISILFFTYVGILQYKNKNKVKYYSTLMGVLFNITPLNMGFTEMDETLLKPETITDELLDSMVEFNPFKDELDAIKAKYEESDPAGIQAMMLTSYEMDKPYLDEELRNAKQLFINKKVAILQDIEEELHEVNLLYELEKSKIKLLGNRFTDRLVFDTKFALGLKDEVIEEFLDIGLKNIIIRPNDDLDTQTEFIRLLFANALSNVFPGRLTVTVFDPNDFGRTLMPFFNADINRYLIFEKDNLNKILEEHTNYVQENFKDMKGSTIQEYNKECEDLGKTPKEYKLIIIMSQPKAIEDGESLNSFFEYSATGGVFIWIISSNMVSKDAYTFTRPFMRVNNPMSDINADWCATFTTNFITAINTFKTPSLMWSDFIDKVIPEKDIWSGCGDEFIEMHPGFMNGDPTSFKPYTVGNVGNVHCLGVGGTGAGKSVFLNHIIATATRKYSPTGLELWLCDFKGTEFKFYLDSEEYPFMLPHIKACLCTSDGDYATSLFKAIRNKADDRYETLKTYGQKNMLGYNKFCRSKYKETGDEIWKERIWPRVLFICDEFQVIFEKASPPNLESIKADITQLAKVARAAGIHIFFTSQSMKKTLSDDILQQFTLRYALRCDQEVSMEVLGTTNASSIKEANGFLYVRSVEMTLEEQKRYRTPFLPDSDKPGKPSPLRLHIKAMYDRAVSEGLKLQDVITYEESTQHPIAEIESALKEYNINQSGVFLLGRRMEYTPNKAPTNIRLNNKNNSHIMSIFRNTTDLVYFFNTIMENIRCSSPESTVVINTQVGDLAYLTDAEKYITQPTHTTMLSEKTKTSFIIEWATNLYNYRKENNIKEKPIYIVLLGWDKGSGIGVEPDVTMRSKFIILLETCGEFNIHFIFINNGAGSFNSATVNACKYKICGKCDEGDSFLITNSRLGSKVFESMPNGYFFLNNGGNITRNKLFISVLEREIESDEIVIV